MSRLNSDIFSLEETFLPWLEKTTSAMIPLLHPPIPKGYQAAPITALPQPLYRLESVTSATIIPVATSNGTPTIDEKKVETFIQDDDDVLQPGWTWTTLKKNKRVTAEGWFQDVREIDLQLEQPVEFVPVVCLLCSRNAYFACTGMSRDLSAHSSRKPPKTKFRRFSP